MKRRVEYKYPRTVDAGKYVCPFVDRDCRGAECMSWSALAGRGRCVLVPPEIYEGNKPPQQSEGEQG